MKIDKDFEHRDMPFDYKKVKSYIEKLNDEKVDFIFNDLFRGIEDIREEKKWKKFIEDVLDSEFDFSLTKFPKKK